MIKKLLNTIILLLSVFASVYGASLDLIKTVDNATPLTGETFTYTLQYRCASTTENCTGVMITDPLPASLEYVSLTGSIHTTNAVYNSGTHTVTFTFQNPLTAGTVGLVTVSVRFPNGVTANGTVANNVATMSATNATSVNSSAIATAVATNKFTTHKYRSAGVPNQYMNYGFELCNGSGNGTLNINNITIVDFLPANTIFHSATYSGVYNSSNHSVTWSGISLGLGACEWPQVTLKFPSTHYSVGNSVTNTGNVTYTPQGSTPQTVSTSITHNLESPWISSNIDKTGTSTMYRNGSGYTHYIVYYNQSNIPIPGFYIEDLFPSSLHPKSFDTGSFWMGGPYTNLNKYVKYKTNLNSTWTGIPNNPMNPWTDNKILTSSLGLASNEYITGLRWEFGPDPWPIGSGMNGSIDIDYEDISATAPLGFDQNCITANGDTITWMRYASYSDRCKTFEIKDPVIITTYIPSTRKDYESPDCGGCFESGDVISDWYSTGDVVGFRLLVKNNSTAGANIVAPAIADLLPIGLEYVDGSWSFDVSTSGAPAPTFVKTPNYKGTGRTHLRWDWPSTSLAPGQQMYVRFDATLTSQAGSGENTIVNEYAILSVKQSSCSKSGAGSNHADTDDLDNDGNTTEIFCFGFAPIDILPMPALSSVKYVKGQLDANWTKYPNYGNAVPGGVADYRLILRNDGNVSIKNIKIIDILPFVGDAGVIDLSARNSRWRPNLAGAVNAPPGVTVYYSTVGNPCRSAEGIEPNGPAGCQSPNWTTSVPSDITTVQSLKFDFGTNILLPMDSIVLEWPMRAPVNTLTTIGAVADTIAWASFGYVGTRVDNNVQLLAAEPLKVGIRLEGYVPGVLGDQVWIDTNQDGKFNNGEVGIDGVRVELYKDNGDGTANPAVDELINFTVTGNGGYYLFPNLPAANYFLVYYLLPNYNLSPANQGIDDAIDSDGTLSNYQGRRIAITPITNLLATEVDLNWDLGIYPNNKASVGDYVWIDANNNGLQDESSSFGTNGYTVNLYQSSNQTTPLATTTTADDLSGNPGFYLFENLTPGDYVVGVVLTTGVTFTTRGATGSSDPSDSDPNTTTGKTEIFTLSTNEYDNTWDFGLHVAGIEICDNLVDDDGDNLVDCNDNNCGGVSITNVTVGSCINQPFADITTLNVTVAWNNGGPNEKIAVNILNKTEYIDIPNGATSPTTVSFVVPANGTTNNAITANYVSSTCQATTSYNAPASCSNDELSCSILYLCGESKGGDADAFDHGLMQYIDGINGTATLDAALTKNVAGLGLFDPNNTSTPLTLDIDTYDVILVSATTWTFISPSLKTALKETEANVLLLSQDLLVDLAMASSQNYAYQNNGYPNNTTAVELYNFNNEAPYYAPLIGWGNYHTVGNAYLWKDASNQASGIQGVYFHYNAFDALGGVPSTHGARTFLGYMMDGVYWNSSNGGATPVPQSAWFDPIRHLTQSGKLYLDQALQKAASGCGVEDCSNGIDDDGDGLIDCDDPDCKASVPSSINND